MFKIKEPIFLYVLALIVLFSVVGICFFSHFRLNLDTPLENWVSTASYFNGVLTPPLLAITSILIFLTWHTSKKELQSTKSILSKQLLNQDKKEYFDTTIRQAKKLSEQFTRTSNIVDFFGDGLVYDIQNEFLKLSENDLLEVYKRLGGTFSTNNTHETIERLVRGYLFKQLRSFEFSILILIRTGRKINLRNGANMTAKEYMEKEISGDNSKSDPRAAIENIISHYYYINLLSMKEVTTFYKFLEKLNKTKLLYKSDLFFEFSLTFDMDIANILIIANPNIENDMIEKAIDHITLG